MILDIFLTFLEIGAVSFGGGYGMISLIREQVLAHGWLTEQQLLDMIAVSESTPGPIAINMATFIGSRQVGIVGSAAATLGVVLPSFIIILLIAMLLKAVMDKPGVQAALKGVRPCVTGLILSAGLLMLLSRLFGFSHMGDAFSADLFGVLIFACVALVAFLYKKLRNKKISPILLILVAAALGMLIYR